MGWVIRRPAARAGGSYDLLVQRRQGLLGHLALVLVRQQPRRVLEGQPLHVGDLDALPRSELADPPAAIPQEVEAHDLEDALACPRVDVAHVAELPDERTVGARFLRHFARSCFFRPLALVDQPLRQRPEALGLSRGSDRREPPPPAQAPDENASCRELAPHSVSVTNSALERRAPRCLGSCNRLNTIVRIPWHSPDRSAKNCHKVRPEEVVGWIYNHWVID